MNAEQEINYVSSPVNQLHGELIVPGDKSISHRAIIFGSIAEGTSRISGLLESEDARATLGVFRHMGVNIQQEAGSIVIHGVGLHGLKENKNAFYFGNSGTSVRLLAGILSAQPFDSTLTGDDSLSRRPMRRIIAPLSEMGAKITCSDGGTLPIHIKGGQTLKGINYLLPVASAQLKSCLLLAGLYASGPTTIIEPDVTRDHTERMLKQFGGGIKCEDQTVQVSPGSLHATDICVPGDISSAAFFIVAGCITPGADLLLKNVGINPTRSAVIDIVRLMGGDVEVIPYAESTAEPVADIRVKHSRLKGIEIPKAMVPVAIDEFPIIMIAAAFADGETRLTGAEELRVKESDRIEAITNGLSSLGVDVSTSPDGMQVRGGRVNGGIVNSYGDHRIAMAFSIAALNASAPVTIKDCINVNTSFPGFVEAANSLGCNIEVATGNE